MIGLWSAASPCKSRYPVDGEVTEAPGLNDLVYVQQCLQRRRRPGHLVQLFEVAEVVREGVPVHLHARGRAMQVL